MDNVSKKKTAIVIGSGAGGAVVALELLKKYDVTILEAGGDFKPFSASIEKLANLRPTGIYRDENQIKMFVPNMSIEKSEEIAIARGIGVGGTTTLATGNAARFDESLKEIGINLDEEFDYYLNTLDISTEHQKKWNDGTKKLFKTCEDMGLNPVVMPKLIDANRCINCSHCAIGCPTDAKWDTRALVDEALEKGAQIIKNCKVTDFTIENNTVTQVNAKVKGKTKTFEADLIVLAAGGLGSPVILENSGIKCEDTLFVDPLICVAGESPDFNQHKQLLMSFYCKQDGFILSPYIDYLSFFFNKDWRLPAKDIACIMIKMADEENGKMDGEKVQKKMTDKDRSTMNKAIDLCHEILEKMDIPRDKQFVGLLNAGHPAGMLPLTENEKDTLHNPSLPDNLYVADATILPKTMGFPPMLTIMALAKKIASVILSSESL